MTIDTSTPSRELDAAVARAMGFEVYIWTDDGYVRWEGESGCALNVDNPILGYGKNRLPLYSNPDANHRGVIADMLLWLQARGVVITDRQGNVTMIDFHRSMPTHLDDSDVDTNAVDPDPLNALALALCRAVLKVAAAGVSVREGP